ncbi:hypothetical protein HMPREF0556_11822 [Listeria grayi DSM 20601]|uniref:Uncharacterized protein n=1 Tax=Listeria grayi DSM 20601 TaxID=525367 RepID=D7V0Q5_LISGR|nr:hypothetical protein HMPREF0556_11822 [Listeria grayi DSM 20601]
MATKSFQTDFKFNTKSASKLLYAIETSKKKDIVIKKPHKTIKDSNAIDSIMNAFLNK